MATRAYIIELKFGITQWQAWFEGEDSPSGEARWKEAVKGLNDVGDSCTDSQEFFKKAVAHFRDYGFPRIPK